MAFTLRIICLLFKTSCEHDVFNPFESVLVHMHKRATTPFAERLGEFNAVQFHYISLPDNENNI